MNHHQSAAQEKDGAKGPPGRGRRGASEAAQLSQAVAPGAERGKPEGGYWVVGQCWLGRRSSRLELPVLGELPGQNRLWVFG